MFRCQIYYEKQQKITSFTENIENYLKVQNSNTCKNIIRLVKIIFLSYF